DERAVTREAVVDHRPILADALEQRMRARHLEVPRQGDLRVGGAADRYAFAFGLEHQDLLRAVAVSPEQKGHPRALGLDPGLDVGRARTRWLGCRLGDGAREDSAATKPPGSGGVSAGHEVEGRHTR